MQETSIQIDAEPQFGGEVPVATETETETETTAAWK